MARLTACAANKNIRHISFENLIKIQSESKEIITHILILEEEINKKLRSRFRRRRVIAGSTYVLRHVRLSVISAKFFIGDFCENLLRKKNVFKGGAEMSGTLYDANRMYTQISVSLKIYVYIFTHTYTHTHTHSN